MSRGNVALSTQVELGSASEVNMFLAEVADLIYYTYTKRLC